VTSDPLQGLNVLLVDDNDRLRAILARSLQAIGCVVQSASRAELAIEMLQSGARPALVLSDVRMPGPVDGVALGHWVVANLPGTRVLLQTGFSAEASLPFHVLEKPFTLDELTAAIRAVMTDTAA
jgi:CheY-like chemotaxis protein